LVAVAVVQSIQQILLLEYQVEVALAAAEVLLAMTLDKAALQIQAVVVLAVAIRQIIEVVDQAEVA
jgi:hypothetical protein